MNTTQNRFPVWCVYTTAKLTAQRPTGLSATVIPQP